MSLPLSSEGTRLWILSSHSITSNMSLISRDVVENGKQHTTKLNKTAFSAAAPKIAVFLASGKDAASLPSISKVYIADWNFITSSERHSCLLSVDDN